MQVACSRLAQIKTPLRDCLAWLSKKNWEQNGSCRQHYLQSVCLPNYQLIELSLVEHFAIQLQYTDAGITHAWPWYQSSVQSCRQGAGWRHALPVQHTDITPTSSQAPPVILPFTHKPITSIIRSDYCSILI